MHYHHEYENTKGPFLTPTTMFFGTLVLLMIAALIVRFVFGLGAVTNMNDGYPWGIWTAYDVVVGSAFACGGFSVAFLVYIFNKGKYHPLVRPALVGSLFGYTLAGVGVIFDLGRYWNFWHIFAPGYAQPNSVMFEVALCISAYILVMWIEFSPAVMEKYGMKVQREKLDKILFAFIAVGTVLPMMHQSSLGSLLVVFGSQIHPLWQTMFLPLIYLMTAVTVGYAVVIFEATLSSAGFRRPAETHILKPLSKIMLGLLATYLVVRFADLVWRNAIPYMFAPSLEALMFWIETLCFAIPLVLLARAEDRGHPAKLFVGACLLMLGGFFLRINSYLVAYHTGEGWNYFPSLPELLVTFGIIGLEVLGYMIFVRIFPVLPTPHEIDHAASAALKE